MRSEDLDVPSARGLTHAQLIMTACPTGLALFMPEPSWRNNMHAEPVEYGKPPVERKVTAATAGSYLGLVAVLSVLQTINADLDLINFLPDWLESLTIPLLPGLITWVSGYRAKHTVRPDLPLAQR